MFELPRRESEPAVLRPEISAVQRALITGLTYPFSLRDQTLNAQHSGPPYCSFLHQRAGVIPVLPLQIGGRGR